MFQIHVKRSLIGALIGLTLAIIAALIIPKVYQSQTEVMINASNSGLSNLSEDVANILAYGSTRGIASEVSLLQSQNIFREALRQVAEEKEDRQINNKFDDLYPLYSVQTARQASVARLVVQANDPKLASAIANKIPLIYNDMRGRFAVEAVSKAQDTLDGQVLEAKRELNDADKALRDFKVKNKVVDLPNKASTVASYVAALETARDSLQAQLSSTDAEVRRLRRDINVLPTEVQTTHTQNKTAMVTQLEGRRAELNVGRIELLRVYQPSSQNVKNVDEQIAQIDAQLAAEKNRYQEDSKTLIKDPIRSQLEGQLATAQVKSESLRASLGATGSALATQNAQVKDLPEREMQYVELVRNSQVFEERYKRLKAQAEELKNRTVASYTQAMILGPAEPNQRPVNPDLTKLFVVGLLMGGIIGILYSFLNESLRLPVRTSGQLSELTGLPVAATMPLLPAPRAKKLLERLNDPNFKPSESFRFMAFSLINPSEPGPKMVMFTGIGGAVGCSSAAAQFAIATAKSGVKTLLVDCDLQHPTLTAAMNAKENSGLTNMLTKSMLPSGDLSIETEHKNLRLVPAGTEAIEEMSDFPTSLIAGTLQGFRDSADVIVIDAPPCDVVSDTARLVPYMDQVCLVVSAKNTSYKSVPIAYEILKRCGAKSIELILTHASPNDEPFAKSARYVINRH